MIFIHVNDMRRKEEGWNEHWDLNWNGFVNVKHLRLIWKILLLSFSSQNIIKETKNFTFFPFILSLALKKLIIKLT